VWKVWWRVFGIGFRLVMRGRRKKLLKTPWAAENGQKSGIVKSSATPPLWLRLSLCLFVAVVKKDWPTVIWKTLSNVCCDMIMEEKHCWSTMVWLPQREVFAFQSRIHLLCLGIFTTTSSLECSYPSRHALQRACSPSIWPFVCSPPSVQVNNSCTS